MGDENSKNTPLSRNSMEISIAEASAMFPGFRFSPSDEELIQYYLKKKLQGFEDGIEVIPELDICRHEPWDLPAQSVIQSDNEWFFFSPRGKKYPNGSQSKRATASGYWKATGKERGVKSGSNLIGTKRTLVFHMGRAPKGQRTEWIMHEYCTAEKSQDDMVVCRLRKNSEFHVGDNSRRNFNNERDSPLLNNGTIAMLDKEQSHILEGADVAESCSKECSNSYNSKSVEQVGTGHESDEKISNEFDSSSPKQGCEEEEEEDCYADIMKDDIIKLDYSSLNDIQVSSKHESNMASKQPDQDTNLQGDASWRLRQGKQTPKTYQREPYDTHKADKGNLSIDSVPSLGSQQAAENSIDHFAISKYKVSSMIIFLVILILLVTFLKGDSWKSYKLVDVLKFGKWKYINWNRYLPVTWR
ncbi:NAC domain-containing protein 89-like isoform X1 [Primulina tabacum]|uniref:NAC domain-containing protein 89-like isoform X1 n=1 Tax=Primulina tabacum TaxID=48773 RepID=UPI003F59A5C6